MLIKNFQIGWYKSLIIGISVVINAKGLLKEIYALAIPSPITIKIPITFIKEFSLNISRIRRPMRHIRRPATLELDILGSVRSTSNIYTSD